jgi:hypothetical protein
MRRVERTCSHETCGRVAVRGGCPMLDDEPFAVRTTTEEAARRVEESGERSA